MNALRNMLFVAALAGLAVGVVMTILQFFATVPLILEAEGFEVAAPAEPHAHEPGAAAHSHDAEEWMPADGFERMGLTALANLVTSIGFALLLVTASEFAGGIRGWRQGLVWGLAGFAVFTLAPGLGLPPELPGMPAAEVGPRQAWWIGCAVATAAGLGLIAFGQGPAMGLVGLALLVAPHLVGAPQPAGHDTLVPADLHHRFVVAVTVTNLAFWALLGWAIGLVRPRFAEGLAPRAQLA